MSHAVMYARHVAQRLDKQVVVAFFPRHALVDLQVVHRRVGKTATLVAARYIGVGGSLTVGRVKRVMGKPGSAVIHLHRFLLISLDVVEQSAVHEQVVAGAQVGRVYIAEKGEIFLHGVALRLEIVGVEHIVVKYR